MGKIRTISIKIDWENAKPVRAVKNPNTKTKHHKPTIPFRYQDVKDDGSLEHVGGMLSSDQKQQEEELMLYFEKLFNKKYGKILEVRILDENDHDFTLTCNGEAVIGQITEVDVHGKIIQTGDGGHYVSGEHSARLLFDTIEKKRAKNYSKPKNKKFWLVIFQTDSSLADNDNSLALAQNYISVLSNFVFDEVWYMHIYSSEPKGYVKRIWPAGELRGSEE